MAFLTLTKAAGSYITAAEAATAQEKAEAAYSDYEFLNWSTSASSNVAASFPHELTEDVTFTAYMKILGVVSEASSGSIIYYARNTNRTNVNAVYCASAFKSYDSFVSDTGLSLSGFDGEWGFHLTFSTSGSYGTFLVGFGLKAYDTTKNVANIWHFSSDFGLVNLLMGDSPYAFQEPDHGRGKDQIIMKVGVAYGTTNMEVFITLTDESGNTLSGDSDSDFFIDNMLDMYYIAV